MGPATRGDHGIVSEFKHYADARQCDRPRGRDRGRRRLHRHVNSLVKDMINPRSASARRDRFSNFFLVLSGNGTYATLKEKPMQVR